MKLKTLLCLGTFATAVIVSACDKDDDDTNITGISAQDTTYILKAYQSNNAEIGTSQLALTRATDPDVLSFAQMMIAHHTTAQTNLMRLKDSVNAPVVLADSLDAEQRGMRDSLAMLSGPAFDSSYMAGQVRGHIKTLVVFDTEISNGQNAQVKNFATRNRPMIESHRVMADSIYTNDFK